MKAQRFGRYLLLDRVASGGMAEVWRCKLEGEAGFSRIYAVKKILPHVAEDGEFITMFQDEANITVQMQHANIGQVFEFNKIDGIYYIAMEYISGKDLKTVWSYQRSRKTTMPLELACHVVQKMADGLDYAHRKKDNLGREMGIVHRDVSPQNALLSWDGEVKVIDFGIAKAADKSGRTRAGTLKGKFAYMSPEQIRGLPLDGRADVFALGVVLYELVTGERGFQAESEFSLLEMVRNVEIKPPTLVNTNIPQELERIIFKALAKDREHRYQWGSDLSEDLQRFLLMRGKAPSRNDLADFLKTNFTVDYDKERTRLESYKDVVVEEEQVGESNPFDSGANKSVRVSKERSAVRALPPEPSGPNKPAGGFDAHADALDDMLNIDVSADTAMFTPDDQDESAFAPQPVPARGGTNSGVGRRKPAMETTGSSGRARGIGDDTGSGRTPTNIRPPAPVAPLRQVPSAPIVAAPKKGGGKIVAIASLLALLIVGGAGAAYVMMGKAPTGTVVVTAVGPSDARVIIDGKERGTASPSLTISDVEAGSHSIIVEAPGYVAFSEKVEVQGGVLNVKATLRKTPGRVSLQSDPQGAAIVVDGKDTGQKTPATIEVESDVFHELKLAFDGYKEHVESGVRVATGEDKAMKVRLKPAKVSVRILTIPEGANVKVNGKDFGPSPVTIERNPDDGNPRLEISHKGCDTYPTTMPLDTEKREQRFEVPPLKCK